MRSCSVDSSEFAEEIYIGVWRFTGIRLCLWAAAVPRSYARGSGAFAEGLILILERA